MAKPFYSQVIECLVNELNLAQDGTTDLTNKAYDKFKYEVMKDKAAANGKDLPAEFEEESLDDEDMDGVPYRHRFNKTDRDYTSLSHIDDTCLLIDPKWRKRGFDNKALVESTCRKDDETFIKDIIEGKRTYVAINVSYSYFDISFLHRRMMRALHKLAIEHISKDFKEYNIRSHKDRARWDLILPLLFLGSMSNDTNRTNIVIEEIEPCYVNHFDISEYDGCESILIMEDSYKLERLVTVMKYIYNMKIPEVNAKLEDVKDLWSDNS